MRGHRGQSARPACFIRLFSAWESAGYAAAMGMRRSSPVLVGRGDDLLELETAVADRAARPITLLGGEAGVGKTRLVAELMARATADGMLTTSGCCVQLGADALPYAPFVDALGRLVESLGDRAAEALGTAPADLAALVPELATGASGAALVSRGRMYEAVRGLLDRVPVPLVLVLEDIHWADQSSLELLAYLASRLRSGRTAVVATFRTDELSRRHPLVPILAELARSGRTNRIDLDRLGPDAVARLVREIRGEAPDALVAAIAGRSDGNPFLAEELLAVDGGPAAPLPGTLRDILLARLGTLSEPTRHVLDIVATLGRPADAELLELAWGGEAGPLDQAIREAVDRAILVVEPHGGRLAFRHALIGEAVADDLLPGERVRLHVVLARILAERPDLASPTRAGTAAEVAHHLVEAHDLPAAYRASVSAGDAAMAARAYPEARRLYERALDLLERVPDAGGRDATDRIRLLDLAAEACFRGGDAARAVALGRQAVAAAEGVVDPPRLSHLLGRLLEWIELTGELEEIAALGERAVGLVPPNPPTAERAFALLSLASARLHAGRDRGSLELAREAIRVAAACGATGIEACARSQVAVALAGLGRDREAVEEIERAVSLADRSGGAREIGVAHIDRAAVYSAAGRFADLPGVLAAARAALDREGLHDMSEPLLGTDDVELLAWQGRWDEAEPLAGRMIDAGSSRMALPSYLVTRGQLRVRSGRFEDGERDLAAVRDLQPSADPETRAAATGLLAEAAIGRDDPGDALRLVDEALAILGVTDEVPGRVHMFALGLRAAADLAERSRARRDADAQARAGAAAGQHADRLRLAETGRLVEGGANEDRVLSRVAWGLAEAGRIAVRPDADAWAAAALALETSGEPYLASYARYREAEATLAGTTDRARAERVLRDALSWAAAAGAGPLVRDIEGLARRARLDLSPPRPPEQAPQVGAPAPPDPYGLSPREREVLALLVDGRTNREIGERLFITEKTASSHVTHILDKLGVASRGAAAALAARGGLVEA